MIKLSVVIITYNEEKNIARCLRSVQGIADDILIVDSHSTDATKTIAASFNTRIIDQAFLGYVAQKNFANDHALYDHVLSLDADEALDERLKESIAALKSKWDKDGYELSRLTNYCGKWVRHCGWYPDKKTRLFDRRKARWTGEQLHETLTLNNPSSKGVLKGDLLHYSFYTISDHILQVDKFTELSSKELFAKGKKASAYHLYIKPFFRFFTDYFIKLGILDGVTGMVICFISANAAFLKYAKLNQLWEKHADHSS